MIEPQYQLDMYPMVKNRSIVKIFPTKLYLDWLNYIRGSDIGRGLNDIEPISFLIKDFETRNQFDEWLESNYNLLFDIRLNYSCVDKSLWPEDRSFGVFNKWFDIGYSNLILDLQDDLIKMI
jgi:hypothetical protein